MGLKEIREKIKIAKESKNPSVLHELLVNEHDAEIYRALARNPFTYPKDLRELLEDGRCYDEVLTNESTPSDALDLFAKSSTNPTLLYMIAGNRSASESTLAFLQCLHANKKKPNQTIKEKFANLFADDNLSELDVALIAEQAEKTLQLKKGVNHFNSVDITVEQFLSITKIRDGNIYIFSFNDYNYKFELYHFYSGEWINNSLATKKNSRIYLQKRLLKLKNKGIVLSNNELTMDTLLRSKITNIYIKSVGGQINNPEVYINIDDVEVLNMNKFEN